MSWKYELSKCLAVYIPGTVLLSLKVTDEQANMVYNYSR